MPGICCVCTWFPPWSEPPPKKLRCPQSFSCPQVKNLVRCPQKYGVGQHLVCLNFEKLKNFPKMGSKYSEEHGYLEGFNIAPLKKVDPPGLQAAEGNQWGKWNWNQTGNDIHTFYIRNQLIGNYQNFSKKHFCCKRLKTRNICKKWQNYGIFGEKIWQIRTKLKNIWHFMTPGPNLERKGRVW